MTIRGIDIALQFGDAGIGQAHAVAAFEGERLGDHADRENAAFARMLGDDRGSTRAGAAAHAGGDEDHVRAIEVLGDLGARFLSSGHADLGVGARAQAHGDADTQLDAGVGARELQLLRVGVGDDELNAFQARLDHVVDGIAARAADTEDDDAGLQFRGARGRKTNSHWVRPTFHDHSLQEVKLTLATPA